MAVAMVPVLFVGNQASKFFGSQAVCEMLFDKFTARGWPCLITSAQKNQGLRLADMLTTCYRRRRDYAAAVVDVYSGRAFIYAEAVAWLLSRLKKPFVLMLLGGNLPKFAQAHPHRVRKLFTKANMVAAPTDYLTTGLKAHYSGIVTFPYGVDLQEFTYRHRRQLQPRLATLRSFHAIYNSPLAPKVVAQLLPDFPQIQLNMMGKDQGDGTWARTQATIESLGLAGRVNMLGWVPRQDIPVILNQADIFLNTPNVDNTPLSLMEAMAAGLCIVTTNIGGLPFLVHDQHDALLAPPDDPEAMAAAVRRLLAEPELAARLSLNARQKAISYDWATVLPRWGRLMELIATGEKITHPSQLL